MLPGIYYTNSDNQSYVDRVQAVGEVALDVAVGAFQQVERQDGVSFHVLAAALRQSVARRRQLYELHDVKLGAIGNAERQLRKQSTATT